MRQRGRRLSPFEALHLLHALVRGVEEIHAVGEYHGDLHSDNIIVRRRGLGFEVKVVGGTDKLVVSDLGIAISTDCCLAELEEKHQDLVIVCGGFRVRLESEPALRTKLLDLLKRKVDVPGTGPIDVSLLRREQLAAQLEAQLRPVLRSAEFEAFDLSRAFETVAKVADSIRQELVGHTAV